MYPVFFSLWIAMWAVLLVTLPFHLLLHGLVAYRIAQVEGWGAVFKRGRYLREIRQSRTLSRMMLAWLGIAFLEVCALLTLSGLVAYTAQSYDPDAIQVASVPQVRPLSLEVSPDARHLILQEAQMVTVCDLETQRALFSLGSVLDVMWLPDSTHIIVMYYPQDQVQRRVIWFSDPLHPIQVVQENVRYTSIEKIDILTGEAVASVEFPEAPTLLMVYQ